VGSAGGRVGKSTVAAHLAVAMANLGADVIAIDLDLRSPTLHTLFSVDRPARGLRGLLSNQMQSLDSSLSRTAIRNLHLVTGGAPHGDWSAAGTDGLDDGQKRVLLRHIRALEGDVIILDLGTGNHDDLADFFALGDTALLVTSPQASSLAASFAFLAHTAAHRAGHATGPVRSLGSGRLVGNLVATAEEVEIFHAFSRLVLAQLAIEVPVAACVRSDGRLAESAGLRAPLVGGALTENGRAFQLMAESLLHEQARSPPPDAPSSDPADVTFTGPNGIQTMVGSLDRYRRKHVRHEVDWAATLRMGGPRASSPEARPRDIAVRVLDISMNGAALQVACQLPLGEEMTLIFDQLPGRPVLPIVVKSLYAAIRRAGVAFSGAEDARRQVVTAAQAQRATRP
jgi:MinD-like ATPase involved in chromosome partitioning or flagellar assembly